MSNAAVLDQKAVNHSAQQLSQLLADTYVLYVKTQNFHWNVVDPRFYALHKLLEKLYEDLAEAIDVIAERIRALNVRTPASMKQFLAQTKLQESEDELTGDEMLQILLKDHQAICAQIRPQIAEATKQHDEATADLFIDRLREHEKTAWMLKSHL